MAVSACVYVRTVRLKLDIAGRGRLYLRKRCRLCSFSLSLRYGKANQEGTCKHSSVTKGIRDKHTKVITQNIQKLRIISSLYCVAPLSVFFLKGGKLCCTPHARRATFKIDRCSHRDGTKTRSDRQGVGFWETYFPALHSCIMEELLKGPRCCLRSCLLRGYHTGFGRCLHNICERCIEKYSVHW